MKRKGTRQVSIFGTSFIEFFIEFNYYFLAKDILPSAKSSAVEIDKYPVGARCEVVPRAHLSEPSTEQKLIEVNERLKEHIVQHIKNTESLSKDNQNLLSMLTKSRDRVIALEMENRVLTDKLEKSRSRSTSIRITHRKVSESYSIERER